MCDIPAAAVCVAWILWGKSPLLRARPVFNFQVKAIDLGLSPLVLSLSLCLGTALQTSWLHQPRKLGVSKDVTAWLPWNQDIPKHTQIGTHTSAFPTALPTTIYILGLSSCIAKDLNLKKWFWIKVFVRFTTKNHFCKQQAKSLWFQILLFDLFHKSIGIILWSKEETVKVKSSTSLQS